MIGNNRIIASLKSEKKKLYQVLQVYEREFFETHQRQVASSADIRPMSVQYRQYGEIRKLIARLQKYDVPTANMNGPPHPPTMATETHQDQDKDQYG
mmetsp:Transcript_60798/g.148932  ORF Transcript_60798/g.148932 Transcript_60798/m.148932 type:complete len:97 (+) Transcript_60798:36-326(+)